MEKTVKCPKCGSEETRDSQVKEALNVTGKITGKLVALGLTPFTGFLGTQINRAISKGCGELGGALAGVFWHFRVCEKCGHSWYYDF